MKISKSYLQKKIADGALRDEDHILLNVKFEEMGYQEDEISLRKNEKSKIKKRFIKEDGRIAKIYIYDENSYHQIWIEMEAPWKKEKHIHIHDWDEFENIVDSYH